MYEIVLHKAGPGGVLYAVRAVGSAHPLYHETILRELSSGLCVPADHHICITHCGSCGQSACRRPEVLQRLFTRLESAVDTQGFRYNFFRNLRKYQRIYPVAALDAAPYRLLGLRYGRDLFIAVDLGFKRAPKIQGDPHLRAVLGQARRLVRHLGTETRKGHVSFGRDAYGHRLLASTSPLVFPG